MSVPAGQMGGLQGAVNSGRYLSQGSQSAKDLLARLWAAANLPAGGTFGSLSGAQAGAYRQAAARMLPLPGPMLSSVLGHAGLMPRGDPRFRNMGSGVRASPEAIAASYGLGGSQVAPMAAPPVPAGFQGPYPGPGANFGQDPASPSFGVAQPAYGPATPSPPAASAPSVSGRFATPAERFFRQGRYWR